MSKLAKVLVFSAFRIDFFVTLMTWAQRRALSTEIKKLMSLQRHLCSKRELHYYFVNAGQIAVVIQSLKYVTQKQTAGVKLILIFETFI